MKLDDLTSNRLASLAAPKCTDCGGTGLARVTLLGVSGVCACVARSVCRRVLRDYLMLRDDPSTLPDGHRSYPGAEYVADVESVARRSLTLRDWIIFQHHFLNGQPYNAAEFWRMGLDKGTFFHACRRIEARLGRVFAELEPCSLWPPNAYFGRQLRIRRQTTQPKLKAMAA